MKKRLVFLSVLFGLLAMILVLSNFSFFTENTGYDLQLGHTPNQEFPRINDKSDHFSNTEPLVAMAIYPDKKERLLQAQLYVTRSGDTEILQAEKMRETAELAAFEMRLRNLEWEPGEYTLFFKRGLRFRGL